jgi:hypothetical protein
LFYPLHDLDDQIKEIEKLLGSEKFQSSEHRAILASTLDAFREAQKDISKNLLRISSNFSIFLLISNDSASPHCSYRED